MDRSDRRSLSTPRRLALVAATLGTVLLHHGEASAQRQSGINLAPGSTRYLISKDVNNERWAISYNLDDRTVTGNVFPLDGGAPTFLSCQITRVDQNADPALSQYFMDCRAAGPCATAPCSETAWSAPQPVGPIPGSFLLPTDTRATLSGNVQPIFTSRCATAESCHADGRAPDLLPGEAWPSTFGVPSAQAPDEAYVDAFRPESSYLVAKVLGTQTSGSRMPLGSSLEEAQIEAIRRWVLEGAANN